MTMELWPTIVRPGPDPLPFDAGSFGYLYNERDRLGMQQLATYNRMMTDLSAELMRVKEYLDTSYASSLMGAGQSTLDSLIQLGVPADTSSSSAADIAGYLNTVSQALAGATDQLDSLSTQALAFSGSNVLELDAAQIKAANLSRIPRHWLAWGPFPESEQGIYQKAYGAALQSRVVGETIKTLQERQAALNIGLEQAKVREAFEAKSLEIVRNANHNLEQRAASLREQFNAFSAQTSSAANTANQSIQQAAEQTNQQVDALTSSATHQVNADELTQINQALWARAGDIIATFAATVEKLLTDSNAFTDAQRQALNQALSDSINQVNVRLDESTAQVQSNLSHDNISAAQQSLQQATDSLYATLNTQTDQYSNDGSARTQEAIAAIRSAQDNAQAQLQALPGSAQAAIAQTANTYRFAASTAAALTVPGQGSIPLAGTAQAALRQGIANAIATLGRIATAGPGASIAATLAAVFYVSSTATEEQDQRPARFRYGLGVGVHDLGFSQEADLNAIAAAQGSVELPYRLTNETRVDGRSYVSVVNADGVNISKNVPVRAALFDPPTGRYTVAVPSLVADQPPITLTWTPTTAPGDQSSSTTTPAVSPPVPTYTGVELQPLEIEAETYPGVVPDASDLIIIFPADSGIEPVYLMFSEPLDSGIFTRRQLQKKFNSHGDDFGFEGQNLNNNNLVKFRDKILSHLNDPETFEKGTFHSRLNSKVYFNPGSNLIVIIGADGMFISGWHLEPGSQQYNIYIATGVL